MNMIRLNADSGCNTVFQLEGQSYWLEQLLGMQCGSRTGPLPTQGHFLLSTSEKRCEGNSIKVVDLEQAKNQLQVHCQIHGTALQLHTRYRLDAETGVLSRQDRLHNPGTTPITLTRCLGRFSFPPGAYEVYCQDSRWANENQGAWQQLHTGRLTLRCDSGRTARGGTPYACLRPSGEARGLAFHLLPQGNWIIRISCHGVGGGLNYTVVELGLSDEDLHLTLQSGDALDLPEILIQALPSGEPHLAAADLHHYLHHNQFKNAKKVTPVIFNSWFDRFDDLDLAHLRDQLAAAKEVGCEMFVIDAGWFGRGKNSWWVQVGDWGENPDKAFYGKMADFAAEVRSAGLGFGLWMEPERTSVNAPICKKHPEWFIRAGEDFARYDLENPQVYAYLLGEIDRLIRSYQLAWMKIDFNFEPGFSMDDGGSELYRYYQKWYALVDEIRRRHPDLFLEGCASGGLRTELSTLQHFDGHFLSDTVNPVDILRIGQGAWLRLLPGRLTRWTVIRSVGKVITAYGKPVSEWPEIILTPYCAGWEPSVTNSLDFAVLAAMPGMYGLSGDLTGLSKETLQRLGDYHALIKTWREFITTSTGHLLTPPAPIEDRAGWIGLQLQQPGNPTSLVFAYRLKDANPTRRFRLRGLDMQASYTVTRLAPIQAPSSTVSGAELIQDGLTAEIPGENGAALYLIQPSR